MRKNEAEKEFVSDSEMAALEAGRTQPTPVHVEAQKAVPGGRATYALDLRMPIPYLRVNRELARLPRNSVLEVRCAAEANAIERFQLLIRRAGHGIIHAEQSRSELLIVLQVRS